MQAVPLLTQALTSLDADGEMPGNRLFVKAIGLPRELDLTVNGLVRYAEQCPVRQAKAIALRRNRGALHFEGERA